MNKMSLLEILRELHETNTPVSFKSLLNTLKLCDEIKRYKAPMDTRYFCGINEMPCYCIYINEYESGIDIDEVFGNLWVGFIDDDNVLILQYYDMNTASTKWNINRYGHYKDGYDILIKSQKEFTSWKRGANNA